MKKISFSVIIPVYNGEGFIKQCLESIQSQTYPVDEIIVVDDGSTDGTVQVLKSYENDVNMRIIYQDNAGQGAARNRALRHVSSDFVIFIDADDKISSELVNKVANRVESHPNVDIVHFNWQYFYGDNGTERYLVIDHDKIFSEEVLRGEECDKLLTITNYFSMNNAFRRDFLQDNDIKFGEGMIYEDNAMMVKAITRAAEIVTLDEPLYFYRKENNSSSSRSGYVGDRHYRDSVRAVRSAINCVNPRTRYTKYYLLEYYLRKMVVYYERRIPRRHKKAFINEFINGLSILEVQHYPSNASRVAKLFIRFGLISKKRYRLARLVVIIKVLMSRATSAQN